MLMFSKLLTKWKKRDTSLYTEGEQEQLMAKRIENQSLPNLETPAKPQGPLECLGMTFENDEARREHFLHLLRFSLEELHIKLGGVPFTTVEDAIQRMKSVEKWPMGDDVQLRRLAERMGEAGTRGRGENKKDLLQLWKDEVGFPHGEIEDILNLSDPPYYTACPNPFIEDFIKHYGKPYDPNVPYSKEPFAADVSEGKNDPIYNGTPTIPRCRTRRSCGISCTIPSRATWFSTVSAGRG